jgi:hypothetical protein
MQQTETGKVELKFCGDSRILAGVSGAVNHLAEATGMDEPGRATLVAAIEDACQEALQVLSNCDSPIEMSLAAVNGRIEVAMAIQGAADPAGSAEKIQSALTGRIDRVTKAARGNKIELMLVKNLSGNKTR